MPDRTLYDRDFYTWAMTQAEALRAASGGLRSNAVDWENVVEEIESLGREQRFSLQSHLKNILSHLLKLQFSPAEHPRAHWMREVRTQRAEFEQRLEMNPGLKPQLPALLRSAYGYGRKHAAAGLEQDGLALADLPAECPYTLDQVLDFDWFPVRAADGVKD